MAYNIDPNAKNIWIRDPNNTEDLSPKTHTSSVYLDNGHTIEDELGKAKSLTNTLEANESINRITEDTYESPYYEAKLKGQTVVNLIQDEIDLKDDKEYIIPYAYDKSEAVNIFNTSGAGTMHPVLEGQTLINYIQDPSKDAVVLPYQVPEVNEYRIDNTKTNGALDLKMYGRTMQNLIEFDNILSKSENNVIVENNIIKFNGKANGNLNITFNTVLTKPNTTYTFIIETNIEIPESKSIVIGFLNNNTTWDINKWNNTLNNAGIIFNNKKAIFTISTTSSYTNYGIRIRYDKREGYTETENLPIELKVVLLEGDYRNNICPAGFIDRGYIQETGLMSGPSNDIITDYIRVKPNTSYAARFFNSDNFILNNDFGGLSMQFAFFDINKNFISTTSNQQAKRDECIITPENCYYIRLWNTLADASSPGALIENNCVLIETTDLPSTITEYIPYNINKNIPFFTGIKSVNNPELKITGENLCNGFIDYGYPTSTGSFTLSYDNILTDYIKVKPNTNYAAKLFLADGINTGNSYGLYMQKAFYDINKNYISIANSKEDTTNDIPFTTPDNCYYVKLWNMLNTVNASLTENKCVLLETTENPSTITEYIPYTENTYNPNIYINIYSNSNIKLEKGIITNNGINLENNNAIRSIDYLEVKSNTSYIFNLEILYDNNIYIHEYDSNKNNLKEIGIFNNGIFKTSSNTKYIRFNTNSAVTLDITTAFNIQEFLELKSIPNTDIRDEINLKTNTLTRNVGELVLNGSDNEIWTIYSKSNTNYKGFYILSNYINPKPKVYSKLINNKFNIISDDIWLKSLDKEGCYFGGTAFALLIDNSKLATEDLEGLKSYLASNPITVYYQLNEPEIINLTPSIKDQNDNSLTKLSPYNTKTYLSTFKENEILPTIESFNPTYNVLIRPSTTYTLNLANSLHYHDTNSFIFKLNNTYYTLNKVANNFYADPKLVFTTSNTISDSKLEFIGQGEIVSDIMLLEGDYSSKTIPANYVEGVGSSIPKYLTVYNKNLFNATEYLKLSNLVSKWDGITINGNSISGNIPADKWYCKSEKFTNLLEKNTTYTFSGICINCYCTLILNINNYDNRGYLKEYNIKPDLESVTFTTPDCNFEVFFNYLRRSGVPIGTEVEGASVSNIQIEKGNTKTDYAAYSYSKYTLPDNLVLNRIDNEQGTFYDTYDVYSGKYTKNVEKFIIDGNRNLNINKYNISPSDTNTYPDVSGFYVNLPERNKYAYSTQKIFSNSILNNNIINNNKIKLLGYLDINEECYATNDGNYFKFAIKKSKLETDDVAGVRKYLSENPIIFLYVRNNYSISYLTPKQDIMAKYTITNMTTLLEDGNTKPLMTRRDNETNNRYNVLLKPSTKYTIFLNKRPAAASNNISYNLGGTVTSCSINDRFNVITTPSILNNNTLTIYNGIGVAISKPMVLEGEGYNKDLPFVEGMVDVVAPRIRTVGENLFNINGNINEKYDWTLGNNNILKNNKIISSSWSAAHHGLGQKIKVQPGKKYLISYKKNSYACTEFHLKNWINKWINYADVNTSFNKVIEIPHYCDEILISFNSYTNTAKAEFWDICVKQCEEIENISNYKYMQNTLYTPDTLHLRSLPNGVYDELDINTGQLTQRVGETIFDGSINNIDVYNAPSSVPITTDNYLIFNLNTTNRKVGTTYLKNCPNGYGDNSNISNKEYFGGEFYGDISTPNRFVFKIEKNKLETEDLNGFKNWLTTNPIIIQYELEEPIISQIDTSTVSLGEFRAGHVLGNDVADSYNPSTNIYTRRVGYIHLDGSEDWKTGGWINQTNTIGFEFTYMPGVNKDAYQYYIESNDFINYYSGPTTGSTNLSTFAIDKEGINFSDYNLSKGILIRVRILRSKLTTTDVEGFKAWLAENPQDVYYELIVPEILNKKPSDISNKEYIGKSHPFAYKNGHIILESNYDGYSLYPSLEYKLVGNRQGQIEQTSKLIREHEVKLSTLEQMLVKQIIEISYNNSILKLNIEGDE